MEALSVQQIPRCSGNGLWLRFSLSVALALSVLRMDVVNSSTDIQAGHLTAIRRIQIVTVVWMSVEVAVSAVVAARAHSIAVLAFGGDSAIELLSGMAVLMRFSGTRLTEHRAARLTAVLLYCLATFIIFASALSLLKVWNPPQSSYLGMGMLVAAAAVMPWLARRKRQLSAATDSSALAADSVQSSVCAWLSWIALAGLALNAAFGISWADPLAALVIVPVIIKEAHEAWNQRGCCC